MPRPRRIVGCTVAALAVAVAASLAARSHAQPRAVLISSDPADQATLVQAPAEIDLAFTDPVDLSLTHLSVVDRSGTAVTAGQPRLITPERLRQQVRTTDAGEVTVAYHVAFVNAGELAGVIRFSIGEAGAHRATAGGPSAARTQDAAAEANHQHGVDPVSAVLLVLDGLAVVCVIALLRLRPRPRLPN